MPIVIPSSSSSTSPISGFGNGQPNSYFIAEVRRSLRDQPSWAPESPASDGQTGAYGAAASKPFRLQRAPVARTSISLTALAGTNQPGLISYNPLFDPLPPAFNPVSVPVIADGGSGGSLAAATYQVVYTFIIGGVEQGMSFPSNAVAIPLNHRVQIGQITNLPSTVTNVNYYLSSATGGGSTVGLLGGQTVTNGTAPTISFGGPGNGVVPALIISDTGELFFPVAPATGTISVAYQTFRFSDQQILDALTEGMNILWPEIWTPQPFDTTSVLPSPIQWEYPLPLANYGDPRTVILEVEIVPPSAFVIYTRISAWRFINDSATPTLIFEKPPPPGGTVRITYATPYTALSQIPAIAQMLPVYYALARLLSDQEVMRSRADDLPALTGENAGAEKGGSIQTAAWWLQNMFATTLQKLSLGYPAARAVKYRAVERLNLGPVWRSAP